MSSHAAAGRPQMAAPLLDTSSSMLSTSASTLSTSASASTLPVSSSTRRILISGGGLASASASASRRPLSTASKLFVGLLSIEAVVLFGTAIAAMVHAIRNENADSPRQQGDRDVGAVILNTALVAIVATAGVVYFALTAVWLQHRFQLFAAIFSHLTLVAYVAVHWRSSDLGDLFSTVSLYTLVLVVVCQVSYFILAYFVEKSFGRRMYERLRNGRPELVAAYTISEQYLSLLKMDTYLQVLLLILSAFFTTKPTLVPIAIAVLVVTVCGLFLGMRGMRQESLTTMRGFVALTALHPCYLIWAAWEVHWEARRYHQQYSWEQFLVTIALAFVCRCALLVWAYRVWKNFGVGLKERLWDAPVVGSAPTIVRPTVVRVVTGNEMADLPSPNPTEALTFERAHLQSPNSPITGTPATTSVSYIPHQQRPPSIHSDSIVQSNSMTTRAMPPSSSTPTRNSTHLFGSRPRQSWHLTADSDDDLEEPPRSAQLKEQLLDIRAHSPDAASTSRPDGYLSPSYREQPPRASDDSAFASDL